MAILNTSLLQGVYTDQTAQFRAALPVNLVPWVFDSGFSQAYFSPSQGVDYVSSTPDTVRGAFVWNGELYVVAGNKFGTIDPDGVWTVIQQPIANDGNPVIMDSSFDRLAVLSAGVYYEYNGSAWGTVNTTGASYGPIVAVRWIDGYFMFTDGDAIGVTQLTPLTFPSSINPNSYTQSNFDQSQCVNLQRIRSQIFAVYQNSIQYLQDIGGSLFPFDTVRSAQVLRGSVATFANCVLAETIFFVGGGGSGTTNNEAPAIYAMNGAETTKISNKDIDKELEALSQDDLVSIYMEGKVADGRVELYVHLSTKTLVWDQASSQALSAPVWYVFDSNQTDINPTGYRVRYLTWYSNKWWCFDQKDQSYAVGTQTQLHSKLWGDFVNWEASTKIAFGEDGVTVNRVEIWTAPGRVDLGANPTIGLSYTQDGVIWSEPRYVTAGKRGAYLRNIAWFRNGWTRNWRIYKFNGNSDAFLSIAKIELDVDGVTR